MAAVTSGSLMVARVTRELANHPATDYPEPPRRRDSEIRAFQGEAHTHQRAGLPMVDVRSPGEFKGEITHMPEYPQEGVLRGGHIPGAASLSVGPRCQRGCDLQDRRRTARHLRGRTWLRQRRRHHCLLPDRRALESHLVCPQIPARLRKSAQLRWFVDGVGQHGWQPDREGLLALRFHLMAPSFHICLGRRHSGVRASRSLPFSGSGTRPLREAVTATSHEFALLMATFSRLVAEY